MRIQLVSLFSDSRTSGTEFEVSSLEAGIDIAHYFLRMLTAYRYFAGGIRRAAYIYDGSTVVWAASGWLPPGGY